MKTSASSFENPSSNSDLVVRSLHKPSSQETNIKSIFSQSAPVLDPQSTEYSSFSLSNSSSPPYSKPSQSNLTLLSRPSSLSEKEIKISHLFENKSEKLEPAEAPA
ncbi:MAG TPA: hypothetical protein DCE71_01235, partial [Parachlamydiales bacterium]|nr:hypothetical protein [Parachlamydiales bacterium]